MFLAVLYLCQVSHSGLLALYDLQKSVQVNALIAVLIYHL